MGKKYKKIYVVSMNSSTSGGPESLHQLAYELKKDNDVFMYYADTRTCAIPEKFKKYGIPVVDYVEDDVDNLLIVPETYTDVLYNMHKIDKIIWWLSLDFYLKKLIKNKTTDFSERNNVPWLISFIGLFIFNKFNYKTFKFKDKNVFHFYNCEYVREYLIKNNIEDYQMMYLCGPLRDEYFNLEISLDSKQNIVFYNPKKGLDYTEKIIESVLKVRQDIEFKALDNLSTSECIELMKVAKLYIDFGFFPGPERIPREAVMNYCNIITGRDGSAYNNIDIPIKEEYKFDKSDDNIPIITERLIDMIDNYEKYLIDFDNYRNKVKDQKNIFLDNVNKFFRGE